MYTIKMNGPSEEFAACCNSAAYHLQAQTHDGLLPWLKGNLIPPILEHMSFRLGNQLFFIRVDDVDGRVVGPGNPDGFRSIAKGCNGRACRMPMRFNGETWKPVVPGWGLLDDQTGTPIDPLSLVSDQKIEMTDWEVHDFAVQVVRDHIVSDLGFQLMSSQGNPAVNPSLWFVGENGPEWVAVRAIKFPERIAPLPSNIAEISGSCSHLSTKGNFASVAVAGAEDAFERTDDVPVIPLWRGHGIDYHFEGLAEIQTKNGEVLMGVTEEMLKDPDEPGIHPLEAAMRRLDAKFFEEGMPLYRSVGYTKDKPEYQATFVPRKKSKQET